MHVTSSLITFHPSGFTALTRWDVFNGSWILTEVTCFIHFPDCLIPARSAPTGPLFEASPFCHLLSVLARGGGGPQNFSFAGLMKACGHAGAKPLNPDLRSPQPASVSVQIEALKQMSRAELTSWFQEHRGERSRKLSVHVSAAFVTACARQTLSCPDSTGLFA